MTAPKPIPQVPAALCGLFPAATIRFPLNGAMVTGKTNPFNAVYNNQVQTVHIVGGVDGVAYSAVEIGKVDILLDSPLAMCHAARWLAGRHGCDPGVTAPWWTHYPRGVFCPGDNDPLRPDFWVLLCENGGCVWFVDADEPDDLKVDQDGNRYISVAGLKGSTLPAALAAACVAVGGA